MIVHIFGPCNSGKTTLRKNLHARYPDFDSYCIDDFRRAVGDGTLEKEIEAQDRFVDAVADSDNGFFECSGAGRCAMYALMCRREETRVVVFDTPAEACIERIDGHKYDGIPFPFENDDADIIRGVRSFLDSESFRHLTEGIPVLHLGGDESLEEQLAAVERFCGI